MNEKKLIAVYYLTHGAFDITNDWAVRVVNELYSNLSNVTGVSSSTKNFVDLCKFHGLILYAKNMILDSDSMNAQQQT